MLQAKARFPLPELTTRVDGWPVSIPRQHGPCWRARVSTNRVDGPSTRLVETGLYTAVSWQKEVGTREQQQGHAPNFYWGIAPPKLGALHFLHFTPLFTRLCKTGLTPFCHDRAVIRRVATRNIHRVPKRCHQTDGGNFVKPQPSLF